MIICSVCGTTNINGSSYCDECGAVLPESSASHAISQLSPGYSFPLPAAPPPPPITTHAERLCGLCGTIDREDSHFCQTCGTQLSPVTPTVPPPPPPSLASVITSSHSLTQVPDAQTVKLTNPPVTRKTIGEKLKSLSQGLALRYREWFPAGVIGKAPSPFVTGRRYEATLPLIKEFRFVHEPVDGTTSTRSPTESMRTLPTTRVRSCPWSTPYSASLESIRPQSRGPRRILSRGSKRWPGICAAISTTRSTG